MVDDKPQTETNIAAFNADTACMAGMSMQPSTDGLRAMLPAGKRTN